MRVLTLFFSLIITVASYAQGQMTDDSKEKGFESDKFNSQSFMTNISSRQLTTLNGKWMAIIDPVDFGIGSWTAVWKDKKPSGNTDFYEYSFEDNIQLEVPGDFNTQLPELKFYEGTMWYKKVITCHKSDDKRVFLHFGAANYISNVWLNSEWLGGHEGGFSPFQFEITDKMKDGENTIILRVNNERYNDGIPAKGYDWLNYGGITRDVNLIETPKTFIEDYFIQLAKDSEKQIEGWVKLNGDVKSQRVTIRIPEAEITQSVTTDRNGFAKISFPAKLKLWSPESPKLYDVFVETESDNLKEEIGFRTIKVVGEDILLNGKSVFLKGVCFHEEAPQKGARATTIEDAEMLLRWSKDLGCNFVRLAHYPHSEPLVKLAEKMGFMIWSEIPVYQGINFGNPAIMTKLDGQLKEMLYRDKNRCGIIIWSIANETSKNSQRDKALAEIAARTREFDPTRLIAAAMNNFRNDTKENIAYIEDNLINSLDVISINVYMGWYNKWVGEPGSLVWKSSFGKPLIFSEFGAEALYGNHGDANVASSWSEEFQEKIYRENVKMFKNISFLRGTCPWILVDFRSTRRLLPRLQDGWNRKGLLSDKGQKKKAWYVMKDYYDNIK